MAEAGKYCSEGTLISTVNECKLASSEIGLNFFDERDVDGNTRKLSYLEWTTQFQSSHSNDSVLTSRLLRAETDRGDAETEPSMTAIKLKSKDGLVRADFFKASRFCGNNKYNHNNLIIEPDYRQRLF